MSQASRSVGKLRKLVQTSVLGCIMIHMVLAVGQDIRQSKSPFRWPHVCRDRAQATSILLVRKKDRHLLANLAFVFVKSQIPRCRRFHINHARWRQDTRQAALHVYLETPTKTVEQLEPHSSEGHYLLGPAQVIPCVATQTDRLEPEVTYRNW